MQESYVEVAVFSPLPGTFTYQWPESFGLPVTGVRVQVPFGRGKRFGIVVSTDVKPDGAYKCKPLLDRLDEQSLFDEHRLKWLERVRRYYLAQPGDLWSSALGWASQDDIRRFRCLDPELLNQSCIELSGLFRTRAALSLKTILERSPQSTGVRDIVSRACSNGLIEEVLPDPMWAPHDGVSDPLAVPKPTSSQQQAIDAIIKYSGQFKPFLLFGRTGSGKTEVYLKAAEPLIQSSKQVLVLVPEIGLTPMWMARLKQRFGKVALWHSAMTAKERLVVRDHLDQTEILIGTRSALFLPLPRLAMIVVDEEHDGSFKQQEGMSYSARDMAVLLAQEMNIPVVLGTATPSLESWRQVQQGVYQRLDLPDRINPGHVHIAPQVVDMRNVESPVSDSLLSALQKTLKDGDQSILFLNRRGYAPALQCTACGDVPECPDCSMRLTLHLRAASLRCHTCGYRRRVPRTCESCGEDAFLPLGEGTEKLEEWLTEKLPGLRFARFDRDVITSHSRLEKTLEQFEKGELDCLLGTQMLVKGHDFPNVTLVGVVNADLGVSLPDFRASERWWQQMTQVTGRAGRGDKPGRVFIQTRMPEAGWLTRISETEAESTLTEELQLREMLTFPPFARWVRIVCASTKMERATQVATAIVRQCEKIDGLQIGGPMPCPMERVAGKYRIEIVLRDTSRRLLPWKLEPIMMAMKAPSDVRVRVDVDPQDMM